MKSVIVILGLLIGLGVKAQSDTCKYQYRIEIKEITSLGSAKLVKEPLTDLFRTEPKYQEALRTFIFESEQDVDDLDVRQALTSTGYTEVIYFKKEKVK
jgi:hypothetical protein